MVDLGLPIKWCSCNVGATNETDYGNYYRWGEGANTFVPNLGSLYLAVVDTLPSSRDAATQVIGSGWRTPSYNEWNDLFNGTVWSWKNNYKNSGVNGLEFSGNGNTIFIPAGGGLNYDGTWEVAKGSTCYLWTNLGYSWDSARVVYLTSGGVDTWYSPRDRGLNVRGVHD